MKPIEEVRRLSQEEGLFDHEIADRLQLHRTTITRYRLRHQIPRPVLSNRRDKVTVCKNCQAEWTVRRKERRAAYCALCKAESIERRNRKKREYMKGRQK